MKNIVTILMIGLLLASCNKKEPKSDGYVINGTAKGVYNGIRVYLNANNQKGNQTAQDTAIVMDETFRFEGKIETPQMWYLSVDNVSGFVPVLVENESIDISFDKTNIANSKVSGTNANDAFADYTDGQKKFNDERITLNNEYMAARNSRDSTKMATITTDYENLNEKAVNYPYLFLESHKDNYFSLSLIEDLLKPAQTDLDPIEKAFENLDSNIKNSFYGQIVANQIGTLKKENERLSMLNIGKVAPDFSAPNPEGKQVSLNEIRGKVTIIDFWASWCGPCRRENPNVVKVYEKYHDKGLEIISVSLDRAGQKDKWLKAIKDDKLTWHHVSNLNYFNDPVAQQYNIQSIPATFILDSEGKIVAKSLRGQQLEDKIAEMLN